MSKEEYASTEQQAAKHGLAHLLKYVKMPSEELIHNLGLFMRGSYLAKVLWLAELYQMILDIPGDIMEFGTWYGSNLSIFHNLRSVLEPHNRDRRVVGFDTFEGYPEVDEGSGITKDSYYTGVEWADYLEKILAWHQTDGTINHVKKYGIVYGDIRETLPAYLEEKEQSFIALAFLDVAMEEITTKILTHIGPYLIQGSILVLDELGSPQFKGETKALKKVFKYNQMSIRKSKFLHTKTYIKFVGG